MRILHVASEGLPYVKSGGLADVIGSLPHSVQSKDIDVDIFMPLYKRIIDKYMGQMEFVFHIDIQQGMFHEKARIFRHVHNHVSTYFVENQQYFEREDLYGYADDGARFAFFQHAVMNFLLKQKDGYDILHCHDWHTGMVPVLAKTLYQWHDKINHLKHVYTIHNLAFQGNFPTSVLTDCFGLTLDLMADNSVNFHNGMSFMKGGIFYSDKVTTVSKTYAEEILTVTFGEQMEYVLGLKKMDLIGIVNGIDIQMWNPQKDRHLTKKYTKKTLSNKIINKCTLQKGYGLTVTEDIPLLVAVTRLSKQKGIQLVLDILPRLLELPVQLMILGSGDDVYEQKLAYFESVYDNFVFYKGYNEGLAHQLYAAADLFLMPSYFEPCGISQLIAMRYGCLPIVRETGGLKDTVIPYNQYDRSGTGFTFARYDGNDFYQAILRALQVYQTPTIYKAIQKNAMDKKVSWAQSAKRYRKLYRELCK
ncbi:MAG: glycogen synthase GlgA [Breznakia sp.]